MDINTENFQAAGDSGGQRRIVGKAQIVAEPNQRGHDGFFPRRAFGGDLTLGDRQILIGRDQQRGQQIAVLPKILADQKMRLGIGVGKAFNRDAEHFSPGFGWLHKKAVVADEGDHFVAPVKGIFPEHFSRPQRSRAGGLFEDQIDDALAARAWRLRQGEGCAKTVSSSSAVRGRKSPGSISAGKPSPPIASRCRATT